MYRLTLVSIHLPMQWLIPSLLSKTGIQNRMKKVNGFRQEPGDHRSPISNCNGQKVLTWGKIIYCELKWIWVVRENLPPTSLPEVNCTSLTALLSSPHHPQVAEAFPLLLSPRCCRVIPHPAPLTPPCHVSSPPQAVPRATYRKPSSSFSWKTNN